MTQSEFIGILEARGIPFEQDGTSLTVNGGHVDLYSLTSLPEGTTFNNSGHVDLSSLTSLSEGITFSNGGDVYLDSLTSLPKGTTFSNGGHVYLYSLTSLPKGITFSNGGDVYLPSLTEEHQTYQGQRIRLRTIDGYTMLLQSEKLRGEYTIYSARYFGGGDLDKLRKCFIARSGDTYAHGATIAEAILDLRFKLAEADFDREDLIAQVKARGVIRRDEFRLLTGACSEGLRHGLVELGQPEDLTEMPLATALELVRGRYGEDEMRKAFA